MPCAIESHPPDQIAPPSNYPLFGFDGSLPFVLIVNQSTTGDLDEDEMDEEDENELDHGHRQRKVAFMPSPGEALSYFARLYRRPE